ncbi:MAG: hypothetical protein AB7Y46_19530 [Armatimonadota bacterium]
MMTRGILGTLAIVVAATLVFGGMTPQPARADDTARIIAGIAAGALVYGLLGDDDDGGHRYYARGADRGFYCGNSGTWSYSGRSSYRTGDHGQRQYRRGYDRGWNDGYEVGFDDGKRYGYDRGWSKGYDCGYDDGWSDGSRYGRRSGYRGWGF